MCPVFHRLMAVDSHADRTIIIYVAAIRISTLADMVMIRGRKTRSAKNVLA